MTAKRVERIVVAEAQLHARACEIADDAAHEPDGNRRPQRDEAAAGRDGNEPDHEPCAGPHEGGLLGENDIHHHPRELRGGAREGRRGECVHREPVCRERAAGIEAEPTKQEHGRSDCHQWHVMDSVVHVLIPDAPTQDNAEHQAGYAGANVDHVASRKVDRADRRERTALAPYHVGDGIVHHERPEQHEQHERLEAHAPGDGTRDERRGDDGEHHLEQGICKKRDAGCIRSSFRGTDAVHHHVLETADDAAMVLPEREREAHDDPQHGLEPNGAHGREYVVDHVLAPAKAPIEEREPRCHKQHQSSANEHEPSVCGTHVSP